MHLFSRGKALNLSQLYIYSFCGTTLYMQKPTACVCVCMCVYVCVYVHMHAHTEMLQNEGGAYLSWYITLRHFLMELQSAGCGASILWRLSISFPSKQP